MFTFSNDFRRLAGVCKCLHLSIVGFHYNYRISSYKEEEIVNVAAANQTIKMLAKKISSNILSVITVSYLAYVAGEKSGLFLLRKKG